MFFHQYQLGCLSLFSYLIGDETTGRAVVIDPQRDVSQYLLDADARDLRIERVIETHFHADFLSGHLELAAATGATISFGEGAQADFPLEPLADGTRLVLGEVVLEIRATPGHTPESISVVVFERPDAQPWGVLTGDALFIGDVGRPDLLASVGWTPDQLARRLYRSLHDKLLTLPDATRVYPAHGAGSACGKSMADAVVSTIGEQRATNYALAPMSEDAFVEALLQGQSVAPLYFGFAADANRRAHGLLDDQAPVTPLDWLTLEAAQQHGAVLIDGRIPEVFASGHVRGSINVSLDGRFAEYAGDVARPAQPIVVITDAGRESEAKVRLARIGFDDVRGALVDVEAVLAAHPEVAETARRFPARDVALWRDEEPDVQVVDVRNPAEQAAGVVPGARSVPLPALLDRIGELDSKRPIVVYCAGGYRSSVAASLLRAHGFERVADILGGFEAWRAAAYRSRTANRNRPRLTPDERDRPEMRALLVSPLGFLIGVSLGALGGGGSILAVPVLVYAAGQGAKAATATSLLLVGVAALVGMGAHHRAGRVRVRTGIVFGLAGIGGSIAGTALNRRLDPNALLLGFSVLILVAAWRMVVGCPTCTQVGEERALVAVPTDTARVRVASDIRLATIAKVLLAGTAVGFLTGLFGVGGGFVIVPALTLVLGLSMPEAIGTSLLVIAINSAVALVTRLGSSTIDWNVAIPFTVAAILGVLVGKRIADRLDAQRSLNWFAALLVGVAAYTAIQAGSKLLG